MTREEYKAVAKAIRARFRRGEMTRSGCILAMDILETTHRTRLAGEEATADAMVALLEESAPFLGAEWNDVSARFKAQLLETLARRSKAVETTEEAT